MGCPSVNTMLDWLGAQPPEAALLHLSACSRCREIAGALKTSQGDAWLDFLQHDHQAPAPGMVIEDRYRLERCIGAGATGLVWEARSLHGEQRVAVKLLKAHRAAHVRRLVREARVVAALRHEGIVEMVDVLESNGAPAIVMELLEGESLAALLERRGRLEVTEAVAIGSQVAAALAAAHDKGVVHRDLKPENIFVTRDSPLRVKVLDFGMAKIESRSAIGATSTSLTRTGALVGTPCYMAPEQLFGDQDVDARADVWALGAVLYECLAGKRPVHGEHLGQIFKRIALGDIVALASLRPEVPRSLDALVTRMLARDRTERPASMTAVLAKLHDNASTRPRRRWLVAGAVACLSVAALPAMKPSNASDARAETGLAELTAPPLELARVDRKPTPRAPSNAPEPARAPRAPTQRAPAQPESAADVEPVSPLDRLPGGVLKTSPY